MYDYDIYDYDIYICFFSREIIYKTLDTRQDT